MKHRNVTCDGCHTSDGVIGMRWKCSRCYDFDLCTHCYMANQHSLDHRFVRCDNEKLRYTTHVWSVLSSVYLHVHAYRYYISRLHVFLTDTCIFNKHSRDIPCLAIEVY